MHAFSRHFIKDANLFPPLKLPSIQILRFLAAFLVIVGHAQGFAAAYADRFGYQHPQLRLFPWCIGVDIFFIISGFIMIITTYSEKDSSSSFSFFLLKRFFRVVPLYWLILGLEITRIAAQGKTIPSWQSCFASFFFIPYDSQRNGILRPFYEIGWTLNFEMFFYFVLAAFVSLGLARCFFLTSITLCLFIISSYAFSSTFLPLSIWGNPLMIEFVLGMVLGVLYKLQIRISLVFFICILFVFSLFFCFFSENDLNVSWKQINLFQMGFQRLIFFGLPAFIICSGFCLCTNIFNKRLWKPFIFLGDSSYSLYLIHPLLLSGYFLFVFLFNLQLFLPFNILLLFSIILSLLGGLFLYILIERPFLRFSKLFIANSFLKRPCKIK